MKNSPASTQVDDLLGQIRETVALGERVLVTTLTKRMAEDLSEYLMEMGIKVHYLHSEVDTLERVGILRDLRLGKIKGKNRCPPVQQGFYPDRS